MSGHVNFRFKTADSRLRRMGYWSSDSPDVVIGNYSTIVLSTTGGEAGDKWGIFRIVDFRLVIED